MSLASVSPPGATTPQNTSKEISQLSPHYEYLNGQIINDFDQSGENEMYGLFLFPFDMLSQTYSNQLTIHACLRYHNSIFIFYFHTD